MRLYSPLYEFLFRWWRIELSALCFQVGEDVMVEADSSDYTATWTITSVSVNDTGNYYCDGGLYSGNVLIANTTSPTSAIIIPGMIFPTGECGFIITHDTKHEL